VRIYTRSLNEISAAIPEIVELARTFSAHALVLDGEAIAFDARGRPHPFQVTMKRFGRKLNVAASRTALPIQAFFFDCLKVGDESIAGRSTAERFTALAGAVPAPLLIPRLVTSSEPEASIRYPGGLALRLARVKRYRDDKRVDEADTMDAVRKIYAAQAGPAQD
jgi:DNA ligase-1